MFNQVQVFSILDVYLNVAVVSKIVDQFVGINTARGCFGFDIHPTVATPEYISGSPANKYWFTVLVSYYDPAVQ